VIIVYCTLGAFDFFVILNQNPCNIGKFIVQEFQYPGILVISNLGPLAYCQTLVNATEGTSVADPGCFIPDPDPTIAPSRIRIRIPDPGGKKHRIPDPTSFITNFVYLSRIPDPDPTIAPSRIPDPDPGSGG
jgi:hypothetical protein